MHAGWKYYHKGDEMKWKGKFIFIVCFWKQSMQFDGREIQLQWCSAVIYLYKFPNSTIPNSATWNVFDIIDIRQKPHFPKHVCATLPLICCGAQLKLRASDNKWWFNWLAGVEKADGWKAEAYGTHQLCSDIISLSLGLYLAALGQTGNV